MKLHQTTSSSSLEILSAALIGSIASTLSTPLVSLLLLDCFFFYRFSFFFSLPATGCESFATAASFTRLDSFFFTSFIAAAMSSQLYMSSSRKWNSERSLLFPSLFSSLQPSSNATSIKLSQDTVARVQQAAECLPEDGHLNQLLQKQQIEHLAVDDVVSVLSLDVMSMNKKNRNSMEASAKDAKDHDESKKDFKAPIKKKQEEEDTSVLTSITACSDDEGHSSSTDLLMLCSPSTEDTDDTVSTTEGDDGELNEDKNNIICSLKLKLQETQSEMNILKNQKAKIIGNIKRAKASAAQAMQDAQYWKQKHVVLSRDYQTAQEEVMNLQADLHKRDEDRASHYHQQARLAQQREQYDAMVTRVEEMEHQNGTMLELLEQYRSLARHTGYSTWGKKIRLLEAKVLAQPSGEK